MTTSQSTQFKPKPPTMNCTTCNFPHPEHELRDGKCLDCLVKELQVQEDRILNLLAVIHRDGGHHADINGIKASISAAVSVVLDLRADLARVQDRVVVMGDALQRLASGDHVGTPINQETGAYALIEDALSADAGRGWASPEDVKVLVEALDRIYRNALIVDGENVIGVKLEWIKHTALGALNHAKEKGLTQ